MTARFAPWSTNRASSAPSALSAAGPSSSRQRTWETLDRNGAYRCPAASWVIAYSALLSAQTSANFSTNPSRTRRRHEVSPQGQRSHHRQLVDPCIEQRARLLQMAFLSWPLPTRHHPVESLQFRQHLRGRRGRYPGLVSDLLHSEPLAIPHQDRVQHLRAAAGKHGNGWLLTSSSGAACPRRHRCCRQEETGCHRCRSSQPAHSSAIPWLQVKSIGRPG